MPDPVVVYKDTKQKSIAAIDLQGWIAEGWATTLPETGNPDEDEPEIDTGRKGKKLIAQIPSPEQ